MADSLWRLPEIQHIRTPTSILREQAAILSDQTEGYLYGSVATIAGDDTLRTILKIVVPRMNSYSYDLLTYIQDVISIYPGRLVSHPVKMGYPIRDEAQFTETLSTVLASEQVFNVISSLLAQAKAD